MIHNACFINGKWEDFKSLGIPVCNPATGETIGHVPDCGSQGTLLAIEAAQLAFPGWKSLPAVERSALLKKLSHLIHENLDELATLLTYEQGKPLSEARRELAYGAAYFDWFAEEGRRVYGDIVPSPKPHQKIFVIKEPVGVCAAITPWNFPSAMIARKAAAALAAGCTFIVKPAPETPLSALALADLSLQAGVPPGVFNVITGDAIKIGETLMNSPAVRKISFTGSTEVGKILLRQSAETVKKLTLELGGNAPFIIFDDADLEQAVEGAIFAKFRNAGQTCICANRFLVQKEIADRFHQKLINAVKLLTVGNGSLPNVDIGPLISQEAKDKVGALLRDAIAKGAVQTYGSTAGQNLFFSPVILTNVTPAMDLWNEEIFGPVAAITTFSDEKQAISLANSTMHGLAAYLYTRDLSRIFRLGEALEFGMIGVNNTAISTVEAPFGGVKQSGFGREGSKYGLDDYLNIKYISLSV